MDEVIKCLSIYNFTAQKILDIYRGCLSKYEERYYSRKSVKVQTLKY